MDRQPARLTFATLVVVALLAGSATWASAHPGAAVPVDVEPAPLTLAVAAPAPAEAVPAPVPIGAALALTLALGAAVAASRRGLIVALALIAGGLAVESSIHSVHHLADGQDASECAVATATTQVHGTTEQVPVHDLWLPTPVGAVLTPETDRPGARPLRPGEGRAPPAA